MDKLDRMAGEVVDSLHTVAEGVDNLRKVGEILGWAADTETVRTVGLVLKRKLSIFSQI